MIDTVLNLLFRCSHRRLTRPMAPLTKAGTPHAQSYVVCLDCGKQFEYDLQAMRIGKVIERSNDAGVMPPEPHPTKRKFAYAIAAAIPAAVLLRAIFKENGKTAKPEKPGGSAPPA